MTNYRGVRLAYAQSLGMTVGRTDSITLEQLMACKDDSARRLLLRKEVEPCAELAKLRRIMAACETAIGQCKAQGETAEEIVGQLGVALRGIKKGKR